MMGHRRRGCHQGGSNCALALPSGGYVGDSRGTGEQVPTELHARLRSLAPRHVVALPHGRELHRPK